RDHEFLPEEVADTVRENDLRILEALTPLELEESVPSKDGSMHTYISVKVPLRGAGGVAYGVCGISTDITHRVEAAKERSTLLGEGQEALQIRDESLTVASHEPRTPLTPLRLQMQLLQRRLRDPELSGNAKAHGLERLVGISSRGVDRLTKLVDE